ncbi:MAM and LDL-receptor class A domain-containing protein 1-like [Acanthaster planci]|uniref:MAM and LDL-receptor class A domain-containing protein 1-like n=1 Tax=Acanthaster planci TaxID=133434 RepID=A0A8B7YUY5_ACAPL|nr:MAM and LDL-receptor class A domain-containing protein 1-like [Acanthaster planci]
MCSVKASQASSQNTFNCAFESGFCGWAQATDDDGDFDRNQGSTPTWNTGPSSDHTTGTGYYAYMEGTGKGWNNKLRLVSPDVTVVPSSGVKCVRFWYHIYGVLSGSLYVYTSSDGTAGNLGSAIFQRIGSQGDQWLEAGLDVTSSVSPFKVVFEAQRGLLDTSDIALDDVELLDGYCSQVVITPTSSTIPSLRECDFEDPSICGFTQDTNDNFNWQRKNGQASSGTTGPKTDHTTETTAGYYMYIDSQSRQVGDLARLSSPFFPSTNGECLEIYFYMYGANVGTLNIYLVEKGGDPTKQIPDWTRTGNQDDRWLMARMAAFTTLDYQVVLEATVGGTSLAVIAIDDLRIVSGSCQMHGDCSFESNSLCGWIQDTIDQIDWLLKTGAKGSGPKSDHTMEDNTGWYIYLDAASAQIGNEAYLSWFENGVADPTTVRCLTFWYYMSGANTGTLAIKREDVTTDVKWELSGEQGSSWNFGQITIQQSFSLIIIIAGKVTSTLSSGNDIAVDDIILTDNFCPTMPPGAGVGTPVTPSPATTNPPVVIPPGPANCDFEAGTFCSFTSDSTADFNWVLRQGPASTSGHTGPKYDHTKRDATGYYALADASGNLDKKARLMSGDVPSPGGSDNCLTFWYYMYGDRVANLNVYLQQQGSGLGKPFWMRTASQGEHWIMASVELAKLTNTYKVVFEGVTGKGSGSDIAIDDIMVASNACPIPTKTPGGHPLSCDFEQGFVPCGWSQEDSTSGNDNFDWGLGSGNTVTFGTGPAFDHTLGTGSGTYLYINASPQKDGDKAWIKTGTYPPAQGHCLEFYYHMRGIHIGRLNVFLKENDKYSHYYFTINGNLGEIWNVGRFPFVAYSDYQVVFEATVGNGDQGDIAIDDVEIFSGTCPPIDSCNFDDASSCTWVNDLTTDTFDWIDGAGGTPSFNTGPSVDHTYGTAQGLYKYIEASYPKKKGDFAIFKSQALPSTTSSGRCLTFWYHMYGNDIGELQVISENPADGLTTTFWKLGGQNLGDFWLEGQMPVSNPNPYKMQFKGVIGASYEGDIALDDIEFKDTLCGVYPSNADTGATLPTHPPPPTTVWPATYDCDFEQDMCSYTDATDDDFDWRRLSGATGSSQTGPSVDHTLGTSAGYYIYIEVSFQSSGDKARLESPIITASTTPKCLTFWYHMYGDHINQLNVYTRDAGSTALGPAKWTRKGTRDDQWYVGDMMGTSTAGYQIIFEGIAGNSYRGDIALDDITVTNGLCPVRDLCEFEDTHLCQYSQETANDDFDWTQNSGPTPTANTGPKVDHTYQTAAGKYMYAQAQGHISQKAQLISPEYKIQTGINTHCFTFNYHMFGDQMGTLNIKSKTFNTEKLVWSQQGNNGDQWYEDYFEVSEVLAFRLIFEAVIGSGPRSDIAIDDISHSIGSCPKNTMCDFESGQCDWTNDQGDDFDWVTLKGSTYSSYTGPSIDHTHGTKDGKRI